MEQQTFFDALAACTVTIEDSSYTTYAPENDEEKDATCSSLFFPGCSFTNYEPSLVKEVFTCLFDRGVVDGITLLCCGKILDFEEEAESLRFSFQNDLVAHLLSCGVKRIVTACPNCAGELRKLLASCEDAASPEVVALPQVLCECGMSVTSDCVRKIVGHEGNKEHPDTLGEEDSFALPKVAVHDSCPDRKKGEFAEGVRALFPAELLVEMKHNRATSFCCGALANAFGRSDVAVSQAQKHGEEGEAVQAGVIVTSCMSCARFLGSMQEVVPVHHYLEFLFDHPLNWKEVSPYLTMRFLFEEMQGTRHFCGMTPSE